MKPKHRPFYNKSQPIIDMIENLFPGTLDAVNNNRCPRCKKPIGEFEDEKCCTEYEISGMCQECQNDVFGRKGQ